MIISSHKEQREKALEEILSYQKQDFIELFNSLPKVDAGLAASIFHFGEVKIEDLKEILKENGIPVRI